MRRTKNYVLSAIAILACQNFLFADTKIINKTDLGSDTQTSKVNAISADGKILVGQQNGATIWQGRGYSKLATLDDSTNSQAKALSADGKVIAGSITIGEGWNSQVKAVIWSGNDFSTITQLGTLRADNKGQATVNALSSDGSIAVGSAQRNGNFDISAIAWSGDNYDTKTELKSVGGDGNGEARAISADGSIIGGESEIDDQDPDMGDYLRRATIWNLSDPTNPIALSTINENDAGSRVTALSSDGKIAVGSIHTKIEIDDIARERGAVWSGDNYANLTELKAAVEQENQATISRANAISSDGTIIGGESSGLGGYRRATIWSGENYAEVTDLGTLKSDNTGTSSVLALSADGKVATGWANSDSGQTRAVMWDIYTKTAIDVQNTQLSLANMSSDMMSVAGLEYSLLRHLQDGCYTKDGFCYGVNGEYKKNDEARDASMGLNLGYGFGNGFLLGVAVDRSFYRHLPDSLKRDNANFGIGVFAEYRDDFNAGKWYVKSGISWDRYKIKSHRNALLNTENGYGTSKLNGLAYSLTAGVDFAIKEALM